MLPRMSSPSTQYGPLSHLGLEDACRVVFEELSFVSTERDIGGRGVRSVQSLVEIIALHQRAISQASLDTSFMGHLLATLK